jgi:hypothetical protein
MGEVVLLGAVMVSYDTEAVEALERARTAARVFLREEDGGAWIVHAGDSRRGGSFRDRHAAFRHVAQEFGDRAAVVIQPRFPVHRKAPPSRTRQAASTAQRTLKAR